ncbi:MAG TPA: hypothetical protein VEK07_22920 [Polyangiaceae bacterium]|nr:hypothetical protein [Polyangiaceae bacterium]
MAPAERSDVIVDFSGQTGKRFVLTNTAVTPYPGGGVFNATPDGTLETLPPPAQQGAAAGDANGPYELTDQIMEFRVDLSLEGGTDTSYNPAATTPPALRATPIVDIKPADNPTLPVDAHRQLILDEVEDVTTGLPVEVVIENAHWSGPREGSSTVIQDSVSNGDGVNTSTWCSSRSSTASRCSPKATFVLT